MCHEEIAARPAVRTAAGQTAAGAADAGAAASQPPLAKGLSTNAGTKGTVR